MAASIKATLSHGLITPPTGDGIQPPDDDTMCGVYGFWEHANDARAVGVTFRFDPVPQRTENGWGVSRKPISATVDADGQLSVELDFGCYRVWCPDYGLRGRLIELSEPLFDLTTIIE